MKRIGMAVVRDGGAGLGLMLMVVMLAFWSFLCLGCVQKTGDSPQTAGQDIINGKNTVDKSTKAATESTNATETAAVQGLNLSSKAYADRAASQKAMPNVKFAPVGGTDD